MAEKQRNKLYELIVIGLLNCQVRFEPIPVNIHCIYLPLMPY